MWAEQLMLDEADDDHCLCWQVAGRGLKARQAMFTAKNLASRSPRLGESRDALGGPLGEPTAKKI
jgi:hypothetical protein